MRLRASFTVENSVIIPLFTMIIVVMVNVMLYLHDSVIVSNAVLRASIHIEFESADSDGISQGRILSDMSDYIDIKAIAYADKKAVYRQAVLESNTVKAKRPVEVIRLVNIIRELR